MAELSDAEIDAALERGRSVAGRETRAVAVRYDETAGRLDIQLANGCSFSFPPKLVQGLETATDAELAAVALLGNGYGLHWRDLDVDLTVGGILAGVFGTAAFMAQRAGRTLTTAKARAARANGAKGGRPRRTA